MNAALTRPACGQCARAANNLFPLCGQTVCIECLVAASLEPEPKANLCLCSNEVQAAACPGRPADDLLPRKACYECKTSFPISAVASGKLQSLGAIYLCNPCGEEMFRQDQENQRRQARQKGENQLCLS